MGEHTPNKETKRERVKRHLSNKRSFELPVWCVYVILALSLVAFLYAAVQQFRVWRWQKILRAAKVEIASLQADKSTAELEAIRRVAKSAIRVDKDKLKKIDQKLSKLKEKREKIRSDVNRMDNRSLLEAFRQEGF